MWDSERQRSTVCHLMLDRVNLGHLWHMEHGPTNEACEYHRDDDAMRPSCWSSGEVLMWRLAWDIHNGSGHLEIGLALEVLDGPLLLALGSLMQAFAAGGAMLSAWIGNEVHEASLRHPGPAPLRSVP